MGLKLKKNGLRNKHKMHADKLIFNKNILKASNAHIQPLKQNIGIHRIIMEPSEKDRTGRLQKTYLCCYFVPDFSHPFSCQCHLPSKLPLSSFSFFPLPPWKACSVPFLFVVPLSSGKLKIPISLPLFFFSHKSLPVSLLLVQQISPSSTTT